VGGVKDKKFAFDAPFFLANLGIQRARARLNTAGATALVHAGRGLVRLFADMPGRAGPIVSLADARGGIGALSIIWVILRVMMASSSAECGTRGSVPFVVAYGATCNGAGASVSVVACCFRVACETA
jgi:hypothetical protein